MEQYTIRGFKEVFEESIEYLALADNEDRLEYLEKCNWVENLNTIQAKWGYLPQEDYSDNKEEVIDLIVSVLNG